MGVAIFQRRWEKSQELDRLHRKQMSPIYKELVEMIKDIDTFSQKPKKEQEAFFKDLSTKLILHGPTPVISAWIAWQRAAAIDTMAVATFVAWEGLLRAVRRDLGHDNSALPSGDILRLFLNEDDDDESRALWQALRLRHQGQEDTTRIEQAWVSLGQHGRRDAADTVVRGSHLRARPLAECPYGDRLGKS